MTIDLTGGLPAERESVFAEAPDNPEMRDSVSMWIFDDRGEIALPRVGVEGYAAEWDAHIYQLNLVFPDGRVYRSRDRGTTLPALDANGRPRILGTGPLAFQCVEPFTTWTATFKGDVVRTTQQDLIAGRQDGPRVPLEFHVEATCAVPPWIQGSLFPDAGDKLASDIEKGLMGGPRYEQLVRVTGTVRVDGEEHTFTGSALRIRRQGVRDLDGFWGHCWQSGLFPSGRGFGYITYPPRPDGKPTFNEGFLYTGDGPLIPARVVEAPWLRRLEPKGEDASVVFESKELGITRIEGETLLATHDTVVRPEMPNFPVLFQGAVRYRWDGEETIGMLERSTPRDQIEWPEGVPVT
ncbi:MAG TPA: hypothetical protein VLH10_09645 [Yinghuangia sp.]|uniref:hypothetical protein n=1 Tax=Yinghuangia sp. YIM S10712 TaxID=3436930 RepID=UPI002BFFB4E0|nr:hypothetical protein [Yinghuangia sp.]